MSKSWFGGNELWVAVCMNIGSVIDRQEAEGRFDMGAGTGLVIFAVGAIIRFAVSVTTTGFNIHTIGVILMIVGGIGFLLSLFFWNSWGGFGASSSRRRETIVDGVGGSTTTTVREERSV